MWRSSRSNREPRRRGPGRGFTLLEAMVSLLLLVIVLVVAMTMLFQMRAFAERQQYFMLPRQAARRAADYLSFYFAGASDVNYVDSKHPSPNALIMYYNLNGALTQASYNNLDGTETSNGLLPASGLRPANTSTKFGDIGTDVITIVAPFDPGRYQVIAPFPALGPAANLWVSFRAGCGVANDDVANMAAFKAATGDDGTKSALLMLVDKSGNWSYVQIPDSSYLTSNCADVTNFNNINVSPVDTASATLPASPDPSASPVSNLTDPVFLVTGLQAISFRILTDDVDGIPKLQQKLGLFDPNADIPYPPAAVPPLRASRTSWRTWRIFRSRTCTRRPPPRGARGRRTGLSSGIRRRRRSMRRLPGAEVCPGPGARLTFPSRRGRTSPRLFRLSTSAT